MFWKVEINKDGDILNCDLVEDKGRSGGRVIFVEAETKAEACSRAKSWHEHRKNYMRSFGKELRAKRIRDGMCTACGKNRARDGRRTCTGCANDQRVRDKAGTVGREILTPEEAARRQAEQSKSWHQRRGGSKGVTLRGVLHKYDEMDADAFRHWLVSEIVRIDSEFRDPIEHIQLVVVAAE
jgi:hypothetical protein